MAAGSSQDFDKIHQYPIEIMYLLCFNQYFETYTLLLHNI